MNRKQYKGKRVNNAVQHTCTVSLEQNYLDCIYPTAYTVSCSKSVGELHDASAAHTRMRRNKILIPKILQAISEPTRNRTNSHQVLPYWRKSGYTYYMIEIIAAQSRCLSSPYNPLGWDISTTPSRLNAKFGLITEAESSCSNTSYNVYSIIVLPKNQQYGYSYTPIRPQNNLNQ